MRSGQYPWSLRSFLQRSPTVGGLLDLCEENYRHMCRLAPELRSMRGCSLSSTQGGVDLYLEILEQTPYTTLIHLTYYFKHHEGQRPDPDATFRAYHDARQIEVLDLQQNVLPLNRGVRRPTLEQKWKANLFASKWLAYCIHQGHSYSVCNPVLIDDRVLAVTV